MTYTLKITNSLNYIEGHPNGLFIDHRTFLVLTNSINTKNHRSEEKETRIQLELKIDSEKKTARSDINRLGQGIS